MSLTGIEPAPSCPVDQLQISGVEQLQRTKKLYLSYRISDRMIKQSYQPNDRTETCPLPNFKTRLHDSRPTEDGGYLDDVQSLAHGVILGGQVGPVHPAYVLLAHAHQQQRRSPFESDLLDIKFETQLDCNRLEFRNWGVNRRGIRSRKNYSASRSKKNVK